jgi:type IV secretory pathway VirB10-like protein
VIVPIALVAIVGAVWVFGRGDNNSSSTEAEGKKTPPPSTAAHDTTRTESNNEASDEPEDPTGGAEEKMQKTPHPKQQQTQNTSEPEKPEQQQTSPFRAAHDAQQRESASELKPMLAEVLARKDSVAKTYGGGKSGDVIFKLTNGRVLKLFCKKWKKRKPGDSATVHPDAEVEVALHKRMAGVLNQKGKVDHIPGVDEDGALDNCSVTITHTLGHFWT